jgi:hypothetical protein
MPIIKKFFFHIGKIQNRFTESYINKVNRMFLSLGGTYETFDLGENSLTFVTILPSKYNFYFIIFNKVKNIVVFQRLFKFILSIPYFFTETFIGSLTFCLCVGWAVVGRDLATVMIAYSVVFETIFLTFFLGYFLRLRTVYTFCINTYGISFVKKFIGNPFSGPQIKMGSRLFGAGLSFVGVDQWDRLNCSKAVTSQAESIFAMYERNNIKMDKKMVDDIWVEVRSQNLSRVDSIAKCAKEAWEGKNK